MTHQQFQMQPWHIFSGVFLAFWILMSYFDNFIITLILCVGAGFATDNLNQFMKGAGKKKRQNFLTSASGGGNTNDFCPSKPLPPEPLIEDEDEVAAEEIMEEMKINDRFQEKNISSIPSNSEKIIEDGFHEKNAFLSNSEEIIMSEQQTQHVREQIKDALEDHDEGIMEEDDFMEPTRVEQTQASSNSPQISTDQNSYSQPDLFETSQKITSKDNLITKNEDSDDDDSEDSIEGDFKVQQEKINFPPKISDDSDDSLEIPTNPSSNSNIIDDSEDFYGNISKKNSESPNLMDEEEQPKKELIIDDEPVIKVQELGATAAADGDLLGDFSTTTTEILRETNTTTTMGNPEILKDINSEQEITADLLADIQPATTELLAEFRQSAPPPPPPPVPVLETGSALDLDFAPPPSPPAVEDVLIPASADLDSSLIQHVASTSLAEHEQELANLMKGTIEDENELILHKNTRSYDDEDDDDVDMELEAVAAKGKDEGDPWILDERDVVLAPSEPLQVHAGESLVHLDSEELAAKDDISHCAVFGDEVEPDDLDLDDDEKEKMTSGSSAGSSSSVGPEVDEDQPVLLDLNQSSKSDELVRSKSTSSSSEEAVEAEQGLSRGGRCNC